MDVDDPAAIVYPGGDVEAVKETKTGDDVYCTSSPISSGFTPINYHPTQLPTPRSSTTVPIEQNQARRRAAASSRRQRNPTVAQYLGLGNTNQSANLDRYAPPSAEQKSPRPKLVRKRGSGADRKGASSHKRMNRVEQDVPTQKQVSESFRVAKPNRKSVATQSKEAAYEVLQPMTNCELNLEAIFSGGNRFDDAHVEQLHRATQTDTVTYPTPNSGLIFSEEGNTASATVDSVGLLVLDPETDHFDTSFLARFDDSPPQKDMEPQFPGDEDFADDISDSDLLMLTPAVDKQAFDSVENAWSSPYQPSILDDLDGHDPEAGSSVHTTIDLEQELGVSKTQHSLKKFTSPVTLTTRLLAVTGDLNSPRARKAIVRPPFPTPVRDRSPIIGLSSSTLLRTCFRIGEAINQSCQASKSGKRVIIELFARVLNSERTDTKQHFTFCDLFHAKPPYLKATYDATIWKPVQLFEYDSRRLLEQGRICRCTGIMKRDDKEWMMTVLNMWEATWEDVDWVEGIVGF